MTKRSGFSQAAHCWCSPVWLGVFLHNIRQQKNLRGNQQQKLPTSPVDTQKCAEQSLQTGSVDFTPCDRERRIKLLQKGNASDTWQGHTARLCQRELLPQLHSWCSFLHPAWDRTLLPPWTDTSLPPASTFLILLKHKLIPLLIKPTKVAAVGSILKHSQHCPFWPSFF